MEKIVVVLHIHKRNQRFDIELPVDITAKDLVIALNQAFNLGIDVDDITECYLKTENPITLLRGNKTLREYKIRNGTVINFTS